MPVVQYCKKDEISTVKGKKEIINFYDRKHLISANDKILK